MATDWYWLEQDHEKGPVSFRDLALMVQEHVLNEDDLVRPHYAKEWEKAYRVVGLFYMAKRVAAPRPEEAAPVSLPPAVNDGNLTFDDQRNATDLSAPGTSWGRLGEAAAEGEIPPFRPDLPSEDREQEVVAGDFQPSDGAEDEFAAVVSEAVENWDRRHAKPVPDDVAPQRSIAAGGWLVAPLVWCGSAVTATLGGLLEGMFRAAKLLGIGALCRLLDRLASRQVLSWWFRGGCALAAAAVVGWSVRIWSYYETLRYPNPEWIAAGKSVFPLFGACSPVEYSFMLVDAMAASAIIGFFGALYLEKWASD